MKNGHGFAIVSLFNGRNTIRCDSLSRIHYFQRGSYLGNIQLLSTSRLRIRRISAVVSFEFVLTFAFCLSVSGLVSRFAGAASSLHSPFPVGSADARRCGNLRSVFHTRSFYLIK